MTEFRAVVSAISCWEALHRVVCLSMADDVASWCMSAACGRWWAVVFRRLLLLFRGPTSCRLVFPMSAVVCISIVLRLCRSGAGGYHGKNHWRSATLRRTSVKSSWLRPQNTESSNTLICFGIASYHRLTRPLALSTRAPVVPLWWQTPSTNWCYSRHLGRRGRDDLSAGEISSTSPSWEAWLYAFLGDLSTEFELRFWRLTLYFFFQGPARLCARDIW